MDEPLDAPPCTTSSVITPEAPCALLNANGVDGDRWESSYDFRHCSDSVNYVRGAGTECDAPGTSCNWYCKKLETTGEWATRHRTSSHKDAVKKKCGWWGCNWWTCGWGSGYQWHDGSCQDQTRYLGEACWDDSGECFNEGIKPYDGLHMSCATTEDTSTPRCMPSAFKLNERNQCECNWFDWHFGVACGASQCNGHACVWSTGSGKYSCDYQTDNNW